MFQFGCNLGFALKILERPGVIFLKMFRIRYLYRYITPAFWIVSEVNGGRTPDTEQPFYFEPVDCSRHICYGYRFLLNRLFVLIQMFVYLLPL